jgi:predicted RNA binding protein YcfA (HicA-like mRNA interferase family)
MPKLYSSEEIIRTLLRYGFVFISQKGSHAKYRKTGNPTLTVIVPAGRKEMPQGTFNSILKQSGLRKTDFENQ